jgi:putative aminopeptidase FrvX
MNRTLTIFLVFAGSSLLMSSAALSQTKDEVTEELLKSNINAVPCKNDDRLDGVRKLFTDAGASDTDITIQKFKDLNNLVVTKKGKTDETVVVSAHYDKVKDGCGAIDNWTGLVIIANLYRTLRKPETNKTYLFVGFDKEELGLYGSEAMAKSITKEKRDRYCSNVNIYSFGFGYPQVLDNASTPAMTAMAKSLADEVKMPFSHASLAGSADADSSSFRSRDIPAVTFHGLNNDWQKYLHSSNDVVKNINVSSVWVGYQFLLRYLIEIEKRDCSVFRRSAK